MLILIWTNKKRNKMKRFIIALSFIVALGIGANAQEYQFVDSKSDGFFSSSITSESEYRSGDEIFPALPSQGIYGDQAAPVGSGLLLLAGMGAAYALRKRRK
jgi:MYXO-CTERM domain-containing protein